MPQVISLRLPDATAERLRTAARRAGRSLNEWGALSLEEWLRQNEFADVEFRSAGAEREACLKGALPVWQVVQVARSYGLDPERTARHFGWPAASGRPSTTTRDSPRRSTGPSRTARP